MATLLILCQLFIVLALIFIGARVGGIGLGIPPLALVAMFPAVNGYFFIPHSFQLSGFITTFVSIGIGYLIITFIC